MLCTSVSFLSLQRRFFLHDYQIELIRVFCFPFMHLIFVCYFACNALYANLILVNQPKGLFHISFYKKISPPKIFSACSKRERQRGNSIRSTADDVPAFLKFLSTYSFITCSVNASQRGLSGALLIVISALQLVYYTVRLFR